MIPAHRIFRIATWLFFVGALTVWLAARSSNTVPSRPPAPTETVSPPQANVQPTAPVPAKPEPPAPTPHHNDAVARQELDRERTELRLENEALRMQLTDVLNWILVNVRGRFPVQEEHMDHLELPAVAENFTVSEALTDILRLTPEETFLLEDALDFTRTRLRDIQNEILEFSRPIPSRVVLNIPAFPEQGRALKQDLLEAVEASLGTDRKHRFATVADESLYSAFDTFGEASRTLIFEWSHDPASGGRQLIVNDGWFHADDPKNLSYRETELMVDRLPWQYEDFAIYLPDESSAESGTP